MFLVPKEAQMVRKATQKTLKAHPKEAQSAVENRLDERILPGPSQRPILACVGVRVDVFLLNLDFVLSFLLLTSAVVVAI